MNLTRAKQVVLETVQKPRFGHRVACWKLGSRTGSKKNNCSQTVYKHFLRTSWEHLRTKTLKTTVRCATELQNDGAPASDAIDEGRRLALAVATEADLLKGKDIVALYVAPLVSWTSYMVVITTFSRPQMQAMLFKINKMAQEKFGRQPPYTKQTSQGKEWECMDFGDVVVQVMTRESREYYDIESFYAQAEEIELPFQGEPSQEPPTRRDWQTKQQ
uniref:Ribosome-associated protein n=1 Tax=Tetraselmis sp. GSL018 TaxID=582737 RepID=A0A061SE25_9CHLO